MNRCSYNHFTTVMSLSVTFDCALVSDVTGCISCMSLTSPVNTVAECLRKDCYSLGDKKKWAYHWTTTLRT